jgi:hypothetical protein
LKTHTDSFLPAGDHELVWDGRDEGNRPVAGGVYFCAASFGATEVSRKLVMMR